jgi:O-antigen/teichoic acid export membrane protein
VIAGANLAVIPMIIAVLGDTGWAAIAVGQSVGTLAWGVVSYGWAVNGPAIVALSTVEGRRELFLNSLAARLVLLVPSAILAVAITAAVSPTEALAAAVVALAITVTGMGATWVFVGLDRPRQLFWCDSLPRATGILAGGLLLLWTHSGVLFAVVQLAGAVIAAIVSVVYLLRLFPRHGAWVLRAGTVWRTLKEQSFGVATTMTSSLYLQLPIVIVVWLTPVAGPVFALADRVQKYASSALTPLYQAIQGWVPGGGQSELIARVRRGVDFSLLISGVAFVGYVLLSPWVSTVLGGGTLSFGWDYALATGLILAMSLISQGVGMACLTALGRTRDVAASAVVGAIVGVPAVIIGTLVLPGLGAAWAVAISEFVVTGYQLLALRRALAIRAAA